MDGTLERITKLMKEQRIQDQGLIEFLQLPRGTFSNWRRDKGKSYYEYIDKIADHLGVTIDYLIRGHEIKSDSLTSQETELVDNYRKLTDEGRKIISANVKLLAKSEES